jgi:hypothetical protein
MADGQKRQSVGGQFGLLIDVFKMSCEARMASASDLHEIPIKFRYGLVSAASWYSAALAPSNAAVAHGIRLDLTLTLNFAHT